MPRKLSDREEKYLKILGADPTINSGATFGDGDGVIHGDWNSYGIEVKATDAKSFSIKLDIWKKIEHEANRINLEPILAIDIQGKRLIIMDVNEFRKLEEYYNHR